MAIAGTRRGEWGGLETNGICAKRGFPTVQAVTFTGQLENEESNNSMRSRWGKIRLFNFIEENVVRDTLPISFFYDSIKEIYNWFLFFPFGLQLKVYGKAYGSLLNTDVCLNSSYLGISSNFQACF